MTAAGSIGCSTVVMRCSQSATNDDSGDDDDDDEAITAHDRDDRGGVSE